MMNKDELVNVSKNMVKEYHNRYVNKYFNVTKPITVDNVEVIGYHDDQTTMWVLLTVPTSDELKYEVSYSKKTGQIHSFVHDNKKK